MRPVTSWFDTSDIFGLRTEEFNICAILPRHSALALAPTL